MALMYIYQLGMKACVSEVILITYVLIACEGLDLDWPYILTQRTA